MERQGHGGWKKVPEESEGTAHGVMVGGGREGVEAGPLFPCAGAGSRVPPRERLCLLWGRLSAESKPAVCEWLRALQRRE